MSKLLLNGKPNTDPCEELAIVPSGVAKCPECGGRLFVGVDAWESGTGKVLDQGEGVYIDCENEDPESFDDGHHHYQSDWMPVVFRVQKWAARHLRVMLPSPASAGEG